MINRQKNTAKQKSPSATTSYNSWILRFSVGLWKRKRSDRWKSNDVKVHLTSSGKRWIKTKPGPVRVWPSHTEERVKCRWLCHWGFLQIRHNKSKRMFRCFYKINILEEIIFGETLKNVASALVWCDSARSLVLETQTKSQKENSTTKSCP